MYWIGEIEKHAGAAGRPTIFKDAMTTLSFRLEESLKEDVNLLAEYLTRRLKAKSSAGAVARAFIASGLEQMRTQYPDLRKFLEQQRVQNNGGKAPVTKSGVYQRGASGWGRVVRGKSRQNGDRCFGSRQMRILIRCGNQIIRAESYEPDRGPSSNCFIAA